MWKQIPVKLLSQQFDDMNLSHHLGKPTSATDYNENEEPQQILIA